MGKPEVNGKLLLTRDRSVQARVMFIVRLFKGVFSVAEVSTICREMRWEDGHVC
jgi:hypothetical protein